MGRFIISKHSGTIGRMTVAEADAPKNAFEGARAIEKEGGREVEIFDRATEKNYSIATFAQEYKLK